MSTEQNICWEIFRIAELTTDEFIVYGDQLRQAFKNDFNPQKCQTPQSELSRWLKFIMGAYFIQHAYDEPNDKYYFRKVKQKQVTI